MTTLHEAIQTLHEHNLPTELVTWPAGLRPGPGYRILQLQAEVLQATFRIAQNGNGILAVHFPRSFWTRATPIQDTIPTLEDSIIGHIQEASTLDLEDGKLLLIHLQPEPEPPSRPQQLQQPQQPMMVMYPNTMPMVAYPGMVPMIPMIQPGMPIIASAMLNMAPNIVPPTHAMPAMAPAVRPTSPAIPTASPVQTLALPAPQSLPQNPSRAAQIQGRAALSSTHPQVTCRASTVCPPRATHSGCGPRATRGSHAARAT